MTKYNSYLICTAPRSGSTLLCGMLASTGVAGKPSSYFFGTSLDGWIEDFELQLEATASDRDIAAAAFRVALTKGRNGTEMFGLRMQAHSFAFFLEKLAVLHSGVSTDAERIQLAFGATLFVHLTRPNKLNQAVSYLKAQQTGLWHRAADGSEFERTAPHRDPVYDSAKIAACVDVMTAYDRDWDDWFTREGIEPVRLSYDDLSADPLRILRQALDSLGLDSTAAVGVTPKVKKLADRVNDDWAARFRAEHGLLI
ncbi:Stf0 family sulfotransferase [Devosia sp.]|jgi:LPS sulfotransferase NodH|uniref:Stf0 family sulfotransferase n=1 Tax=Devosia sp. TaxID=1871048 RepID=UPI0037C0B76F